MMSVYDLIKESVKQGGFKLNDKLRMLTSIMMVGQISVEEYEELTELAAQHANGEEEPSGANILGALRTLNVEIESIKARLSKLEEANTEEPVEIIPEWERWDGLPTSGYQFGSKVRHLGVVYISNFTGLNVWEPGLPGTEALWSVVGKVKET